MQGTIEDVKAKMNALAISIVELHCAQCEGTAKDVIIAAVHGDNQLLQNLFWGMWHGAWAYGDMQGLYDEYQPRIDEYSKHQAMSLDSICSGIDYFQAATGNMG